MAMIPGTLIDDEEPRRYPNECGCLVVYDPKTDAWHVEALLVTDYRPVHGPDARVQVDLQTFPLPGRPWVCGGEYPLPYHLPPIHNEDGALVTGRCIPRPKGEKVDS